MSPGSAAIVAGVTFAVSILFHEPALGLLTGLAILLAKAFER